MAFLLSPTCGRCTRLPAPFGCMSHFFMKSKLQRLGRRGSSLAIAGQQVPHRQGVVCSASPSPNADGEDSNDNTQADDLDDDSSDSEAGSDDEPDSEPGAARNPLTSRLITQEVLLFCFQQDIEASLMRALNMDDMDRAQLLRDRLQTIDAAIQEIQKLKESEEGGVSEENFRKEDDFAASFRLRSSLQDAIMAERYEEAAKLRDELKVLQSRLEEASGKAERAKEKLKQQRRLRLGQRVIIKPNGHRGVVCGWDAACTETMEWQEDAGVQNLEAKGDQPFYQVLVDWGDAVGSGSFFFSNQSLIAYVAQDMLSVPEPAKTWIEAYGTAEFANPYCFKMFLGNDECGDYLPCRALRDKYSQERRDVQPPASMQSGSDDDDDSEQRLQELLQRQNLDNPSDSSDEDGDDSPYLP